MQSYGTAVIIDGVFIKQDPDHFRSDPRRRNAVRYSGDAKVEIAPKPTVSNSQSTFLIDLHYRDYKRNYSDIGLQPTKSVVEFKKTLRRVASTTGVVADLKKIVANYAGDIEASKLRKRSIALGKIHKTISGEVFKFPLTNL